MTNRTQPAADSHMAMATYCETTAPHPAPFTPAIIATLAELIPTHVPPELGVHDPFAGEGIRLGQLCDLLGYRFTGTDLESWVGADHRVAQADATDSTSYPDHPFAVVTSPTYNNGVNDGFIPKDSSRRTTYTVAAGHRLALTNTGRWSGRSSRNAELRYWELHRQAVTHWPAVAIVNVKNSIRAHAEYPLVQLWVDLLTGHGYRIVERRNVLTPGHRDGTNHQARVDHEVVLVAQSQKGHPR